MAQIYPVQMQLVERLYDKLVEFCPPVKDLLKLIRTLREESNFHRYGTIKLNLGVTVAPQGHRDLGPINIPGLRAGMELHVTPPIDFYELYTELQWDCMVITDNFEPNIGTYDPTTEVTIRLHNKTAIPIAVVHEGLWQYHGVISRSLNGTDPDTGQTMSSQSIVS